MGPYIPPEYPEYTGPAPTPTYPSQPGMLLLAVALIVLVVLVTRQLVGARRHGGERIVDELTIRWAPVEQLEMGVESEAEILTFGPEERRPSRHRIQS
jgi:hypothetical protein